MKPSNKECYKYWVIFQPARTNKWWSKILDKKISHVCIAKKTPAKRFWQVIDIKGGNIHVDFYPDCDLNKLFEGATIVERWSTHQESPSSRFFHINCVEIVKLVLGIRKWYIITPYQLYHFIKGDKNVFKTIQRQKSRKSNGRAKKTRRA